MVALYARLFQKTFALRILRICNKKTPSRAQALWPWKERMPGLEFVSECQRIFWDSFSYLKQAKNKSFHLERTHQKCGFKYFASTWTWKLRSVLSYASCWMIFCLNIRIIFIENGKPTNQRPASRPRELQVSESELGVQVQAWSRTCQWTPCKVEAIICLNTRCRGRWPANKMDMIHVIFHVSFRYAKLQSHLLAVHFRISSDRKIFPLHSPHLAWHGFKSSHGIQWNAQCDHFCNPHFGFGTCRHLQHSRCVKVPEGTGFAQLAQNHMTTCNPHDWLNQHSCPNHLCDW